MVRGRSDTNISKSALYRLFVPALKICLGQELHKEVLRDHSLTLIEPRLISYNCSSHFVHSMSLYCLL